MSNGWTWDEIDAGWLEGDPLAADPEVVVAAFDRVDAWLGRDWIEASRLHAGTIGPVRGTGPTLEIVTLGQHLAVLDRVLSPEGLIEKLRVRDASARAELTAIFHVLDGLSDARATYEPEVLVSRRSRRPDFGVVHDADSVYLEVTQPNPAFAQQQLRAAMHELAEVVKNIKGQYTLEVFFHRHARPDELDAARPQIAELCRGGPSETEMPNGLGVVYVDDAIPGQIVLRDRGQDDIPRLGLASTFAEQGVTARHIVIRVPYMDDRAPSRLVEEAAQLPETDAGVIMIHMAGAPGGMRKWTPILRGELALRLYAHVSALFLFSGGQIATSAGEAWSPETKLVTNPHADHPIPPWLTAQLERHGVVDNA